MTTAIQTNFFDYTALDAETRIVVQQRTTEIKALMKRAASDIIEIGQKLIEVKERLGHGNFGPWLKAEFDWHQNTAGNFMRVAEKFTNFVNLDGIAPSALYLLAAPSTPESARIEAIARAEEGEPIGCSAAQVIITEHQIEERRYDGLSLVFPPDEHDTQRRQQIQVITGSSESKEWYTPAYIIEMARDVLGGIDLDPASCSEAQAIVQAEAYCTIAEDGFSQPWMGRVWLNPPYGTEGEGAAGWARKLVREYEVGQIDAAILLVKAALGYNWFEELWYAYPTCLLRERVSFISPVDGTDRGPAKHATALIYFGDDVDRFCATFRPIGRVILPD